MSLIYEQALGVVEKHPELLNCFRNIQKELLHHLILSAMSDRGLLQDLTFKGGTCIRLCYNGDRFSEDLDFFGGSADKTQLLREMPKVICSALKKQGIDTEVKSPKEISDDPLGINRWWVRSVTRKRTPQSRESIERIKIELDNKERPASGVQQLVKHAFMDIDSSSKPFLVHAASLADICADKVIAFPLSVVTRRDNPRFRDTWDILHCLSRINDDAVFDQLGRKLLQEGMSLPAYFSAVRETIQELAQIMESKGFNETLKRFLPESRAHNTIDNAEYKSFMKDQLTMLFERVLELREQVGLPRKM